MLQWEESRLCFIFFRWRRVILRVFLYICTSFPAWGIVRELFRHYHSVIPERSRGISRHVPVDLVRWLDFARHDSMIAADRFSDSLGRGGTVYVPERLITFAEIVFFL